MLQYLGALRYIRDFGEDVTDRTGVGTRSVFGYQMRFNLEKGFPAVTTKRLAWRAVLGELLWFLEGSTDERRLAEITYGKPREELTDKRTIWTANAEAQGAELGYKNGRLGPVYGFQWRNFDGAEFNSAPHLRGTDQITWLINEIKTNPDSRRLILSAWNPNQIDKMALPPCHTMAQFRVMNGKLSSQLYQRSADMLLGVPFNIASYALLLKLIAHEVNMVPDQLIGNLGDVHLYKNHIEQAKEQIERDPIMLPELKIVKADLINGEFAYELTGYESHESIKAPLSN